jgi:DNA-binding NtrC family response regulator
VNIQETLQVFSSKAPATKTVVLAKSVEAGALHFCAGNIQIAHCPIRDQELLSLIENNLPFEARNKQHQSHEDEVGVPIEFEGIIAVSLPMRAVIRRIMDAAAVDIPVLLTGETGTGKELVASAIHRRSSRRTRPYVAVNMGAMSRELIASEIFGHERGAYTGAQDTRPGIFEQGDSGSVFLDEIATMDEKTQISLLRVLEERTVRRVGGTRNIPVDVRIIAATNEDLEQSVANKRFREDLFYRLNVFQIRVPPLRERTAAITALTNHFLSRFAAIYQKEVDRVSPDTYRLLRHYPWPGNVRELKNVIQTAILLVDGKELTPDFIPQRIKDAAVENKNAVDKMCSFEIGTTLDSVENEVIRKTLTHLGGNKKLTASILGISRRALYNKIKRHNLC